MEVRKKQYARPELRLFGGVTRLTLNSNGSGSDGGSGGQGNTKQPKKRL